MINSITVITRLDQTAVNPCRISDYCLVQTSHQLAQHPFKQAVGTSAIEVSDHTGATAQQEAS